MDEFMQEAIEEAKKGLSEGGIPIGSVLVDYARPRSTSDARSIWSRETS